MREGPVTEMDSVDGHVRLLQLFPPRALRQEAIMRAHTETTRDAQNAISNTAADLLEGLERRRASLLCKMARV